MWASCLCRPGGNVYDGVGSASGDDDNVGLASLEQLGIHLEEISPRKDAKNFYFTRQCVG
jgi:hypothetical protein